MKNLTVLLVMFLSWVGIAHANVTINEFVSHPDQDQKEWVELINTTGNKIDLTGWKLTELSSPSTIPVEKDLLLLSGIIDDILVFDVGTTKLNDGGDSIGLYNGETLVTRITYGTDATVKNYSIDLVAPIIGKSGALISGDWLTNQDPTKRSLNSNTDTEINMSSSEEDDSVSSDSKKELEVLKITTKIISPKIVVSGIPFSVNSLTTTNRGKTYAVGKFIWNFGDGMKSEVRESGPFDYIYEYPGEYILTLSYFDNSFVEVPDAIDRIIIKVIPSDIYISSVGPSSDPYVEIENKSKYDTDLSGWNILAGEHYFVFPKGTNILQGKKIKLSPKITGFNGEDIKYVIITNPNKEVIATYPIERKKIISKSSGSNNVGYSASVVDSKLKNDSSPSVDSQVINLNNLEASAGGSKINISKLAYSFIGLLIIIILGLVSFLSIKKKKEVSDYVEKDIRAEDMTIIE